MRARAWSRAATARGGWPVASAYALLLWGLSLLRYHLWLAHGDDLGLFQQGLWLLAHRGPLAPSSYTGHPILADAASWVLVPLAAVYAAGGVAALLAVQAVAFASGYPLLLAVGRAMGLEEGPGRVVGFLYLLYPTVVGAALYDFHPDALAIPAALGAVWAVERRRAAPYAASLLALLLVKDTAGLAAVGLGVALAFRRRWLWAAATAMTGAAAAGFDVGFAIPRLAHAVMVQWPLVYGYLGATPAEGVRRLATHPWLLALWARRLRSWEYLVWLLGPLAVPLAAARGRALANAWWFPWAAVVEANLLGQVPSLSSPFDEFAVLTVPFAFAAVLAGLAARPVPGVGGRREAPPAPRKPLAAALAPALLFFAAFAVQQIHSYWLHGPAARGALRAAVRSIPPGAPVGAQDFVLPHVADRPQEWHLATLLRGQPFPTGTYVVLYAADPDPPDSAALPRVAAALDVPGAAAPVFARDGVRVVLLLRPLALGPAGGSAGR